MSGLHAVGPAFTRTMLPNIGRWIAGGAAAITIGAVTRVSAPAGFWGDAPRAWVADLIDRRDLTTAQPIAAGLVAAAVACVLIAALFIWRAPTRLRPLGLAAACLPLLVLSALAGVLPAVLAIAVLAPATWAAGRLALARLALPGTTMLERILLEAGIGLGLVAFAAFAVGLVGWLNLVTVLCFVVLVGGLNAATLVGRPRNTRVRLAWRLDLGSAVLLASLLVLLQAVVPFVAAPEIMYDAVYYHLTIVHEFVSRGAVVQLPNIFASTFPLVPHLSYSAAALIGGLDAAKYVHPSVGLAGTASVYAVARRVTQDRRGGLLAALLWAATPLVLWESSTAYVDLFSSFFTALGLLCAVLWLDHRRREYAILCGIFAGLGLGVKPNMALVSAPMYVAVFALAVRNRRDIWLWIGSGVVAALVGMP